MNSFEAIISNFFFNLFELQHTQSEFSNGIYVIVLKRV